MSKTIRRTDRPESWSPATHADPFDQARRCRPLSAAVVDSAEVTRIGTAALLVRHPQVTGVVAHSHDQAVARTSWVDVDVVVLDAVDGRHPCDQVRGVAVAERIRAERSSAQTRILVVSGVRGDDPVRLRLREAGADDYVHRAELHDGDLVRAALRAAGTVPSARDAEALYRLGITSTSRINAGVAAAFAEQLIPAAGWIGPRGRDRYARRARFNEAARLRPVGAEGLAPDRDQSVPSLLQIQRFVAWATQVDGDPSPEATR